MLTSMLSKRFHCQIICAAAMTHSWLGPDCVWSQKFHIINVNVNVFNGVGWLKSSHGPRPITAGVPALKKSSQSCATKCSLCGKKVLIFVYMYSESRTLWFSAGFHLLHLCLSLLMVFKGSFKSCLEMCSSWFKSYLFSAFFLCMCHSVTYGT